MDEYEKALNDVLTAIDELLLCISQQNERFEGRVGLAEARGLIEAVRRNRRIDNAA